jgi:hypothetical protein
MCAEQGGRPQTNSGCQHDQELCPTNGQALVRIGPDLVVCRMFLPANRRPPRIKSGAGSRIKSGAGLRRNMRYPIAWIDPDVMRVAGCRQRGRQLLGPAGQLRVEPTDGTRGGESHAVLAACLRVQANTRGVRRVASWLPINRPFGVAVPDDRRQW